MNGFEEGKVFAGLVYGAWGKVFALGWIYVFVLAGLTVLTLKLDFFDRLFDCYYY
jgi:hypothetical protein